MIKEKRNRVLYHIAIFFASLAILAVRLVYINHLNGPIVYEDELGYWTHAANFNGLNWSNTLNMWYSFGYSLVLAPIFKITHNMALMYKIGVAFNALFGVIGFLAGLKLIDKLTDRILPDFAKIIIAFTPMMYSGFLLQSNICWAETFLYTWVIITCLAVCSMFDNPNILNSFWAAFTVAFSFTIHNRVLVLLIAFVLALIVFIFRRRLPIKSFIVIVATIGLVFLGYIYTKNMLKAIEYNPAYILGSQSEVYSASDFTGNDMNSVMSQVKKISSLSQIKALIKSILSVVWYLDVGSLGLSFLGICQLFIFTYRKIKSKRDFEGAIFIVLVFLGTVGLNAIVHISPQITKNYDRVDAYFYGRYEDQISSILIMLGLLFIFETLHNIVINKKNWGRYVYLVLCIGIHLFSSIIVARQIDSIPVPIRCIRVCASAIYYGDNYDYHFYTKVAFIAYAFFLFLFVFVALISKRIKIKDSGVLALICVISIAFSLWSTQLTYYNYRDDTLTNQEHWDHVIPASDIITTDSDASVFFYAGCDYYYLRTLRTKCVDNTFIVGIPDDTSYLDGIDHAYFVIPLSVPVEYFPAGQIEFLQENCTCVYENRFDENTTTGYDHAIYEYSRKAVLKYTIDSSLIPYDLSDSDVEVSNITQNYINFSPDVRICSVDGGDYSVTTAMDPHEDGITRYITEQEYQHFLTKSEGITINITRYQFNDDNDNLVSIDYYHDLLEGLVCMEIQFNNPDNAISYEMPAWAITDITDDFNYRSGFLARFGIPAPVETTDEPS